MKTKPLGDAALSTMTATEISTAVRAGALDPITPTLEALYRITISHNTFGAFRHVCELEAFLEAAALHRHPRLAQLPLAGVPIAVSHATAVAGEAPAWGPENQSAPTISCDSDITGRLRAAGAVIVGTTRVPELCMWPATDTANAIVRNPRAPGSTAGGSCGGSAAAVAAGLVPLAHGTDVIGSLRPAAAICGLIGITPGTGTVAASDAWQWSGAYTHGPLATTVADAALMFSVLAEQPALAQILEPATLRIAISLKPPTRAGRIPKEFAAAVTRIGEILAAVGHRVEEREPQYEGVGGAVVTRWLAGPGRTDATPDWSHLERRTTRHLRAGTVIRRLGLVRSGTRQQWIARARQFFTNYDLLVTPVLSNMPPKATAWREHGWMANAVPSTRLAAYVGAWSLAGFPALSIPAGQHNSGLPIGVQLVVPPGCESRLLSIAAQLEALSPWPRTAA